MNRQSASRTTNKNRNSRRNRKRQLRQLKRGQIKAAQESSARASRKARRMKQRNAARPPLAATTEGATRCPSCLRQFVTGLTVTGELCPPCWMEAQDRRRNEKPLPAFCQPGNRAEYLYEAWSRYYSLLQECFFAKKEQGGVGFTQLSAAEQQWFALGMMHGVACELGFAYYFHHYLDKPLDRQVVPGLQRLDAARELELYNEARGIFQGLDSNTIVSLCEVEQPPLSGPFGEVDDVFYDLDRLPDLVAAAAYQDGLLKLPPAAVAS